MRRHQPAPKLNDDLNAYVAATGSVMLSAEWIKASDEDRETLDFEDVKLSDLARLVARMHPPGQPAPRPGLKSWRFDRPMSELKLPTGRFLIDQRLHRRGRA